MARYLVTLTREADEDLAQIFQWVEASASARTAGAYTSELLDYVTGFADGPHRGTLQGLTPDSVRTVGWKRTITLVFKVDDTRRRVVFHAILYKGRDFSAIIADRVQD